MAETKYILRERCKDMMVYTYNAIEDMPKSHRFTLGTDIRMSMINLFRLIMRAGKKQHKGETLEEADLEHDTLKGLIQVALELRAINEREYEVIARHQVEVGRIIGGWIKKTPR